uniref:RNase_H superfamily protein n=1 Tax=Megaviridae environmental sample TaxID=1737588 RepID=A0A5J6VIM9_9VIRU|nr:MAG: RNase_H superfamily protein [Megaviridae environmental sample]
MSFIDIESLHNSIKGDHIIDLLKKQGISTFEVYIPSTIKQKYTERHRKQIENHIYKKDQRIKNKKNKLVSKIDYLILGESLKQYLKHPKFNNIEIIDEKWYPINLAWKKITHTKKPPAFLSSGCKLLKIQLLNACQELDVRWGFILGKEDIVACVDTDNESKLINQALECATWVRYVDRTHTTMRLDPPNHPLLYPNMCINSSGDAGKIKARYALTMKELTCISGIDKKNREKAHQHGITQYDDKRLTCHMMGITGSKKRRIECILKANQGSPHEYPVIKKIKSCSGDFFIDIETINIDDNVFIFMIGIGFYKNNKVEFVCLCADSLNMQSERKILDDMMHLLEAENAKRLLHWGKFEVDVFKRAAERHNMNIFLPEYTWVDMAKKIEQADYCPPGALTFSLKSFVPAMHALGYINITWDSNCKSGQQAMTDAYNYYQNGGTLDDIIAYNRVDVISTMEIQRYLMTIGIFI